MTHELVSSDVTLLDLLRKDESLTVAQLADAMEVTATAIRQRLNRLLEQDFIDRRVESKGRGRPTYRYSLTQRGRRKSGSNFADLAIALWEEIHAIEDIEVKRGLLGRLAKRLALLVEEQVRGETLESRMEAAAAVFSGRNVPFEVEKTEGMLPVLKAYACPYPELAEQDRSICAMEKLFFTEILGKNVRLTECRLDEGNCCTFEVN